MEIKDATVIALAAIATYYLLSYFLESGAVA